MSLKYDYTLSVSEYRKIIQSASRRLRIWHDKIPILCIRHGFMRREINMIRHCKNMIIMIQSQLN